MFGRDVQKEKFELMKLSLIEEIKAMKGLGDLVDFLTKHVEILKLATEMAEKYGDKKK